MNITRFHLEDNVPQPVRKNFEFPLQFHIATWNSKAIKVWFMLLGITSVCVAAGRRKFNFYFFKNTFFVLLFRNGIRSFVKKSLCRLLLSLNFHLRRGSRCSGAKWRISRWDSKSMLVIAKQVTFLTTIDWKVNLTESPKVRRIRQSVWYEQLKFVLDYRINYFNIWFGLKRRVAFKSNRPHGRTGRHSWVIAFLLHSKLLN